MKATAVKVSEAEFTRTVIEYARFRRWLVNHQRPARTARGWRTAIQGDAGFPDIIAVRLSRTVVAELKLPGNRATPAQKLWLAAFVAAGAEVFIWTPADWSTIERVLA